MMARVLILAAVLCAVIASAHAGNALGPYKVTKVTSGGLSAGAFMAVQYHVAFSSEISGCSAFAGGPYYCAQDSEDTALINCMNPNDAMKVPSTSYLVGLTDLFSDEGKIDDPKNISSAQVYLYSGLLDSVVHRPVMQGLQSYYEALVNSSMGGNVTTEFDIVSEHMYPTLNYGESCTSLGEPYIGKCNYDGAGVALKTLYGPLKPSVTPVSANLMQWSQSEFVSDPASLSLGPTGYIYVPTACQSGAECTLHIEFHGCDQSISNIQEQYVEDTGLNNWAESNNIIVLYPQVIHSDLSPSNPEGCWDWWGYTNSNYAFQTGPQMAFVHKVQQTIMGN